MSAHGALLADTTAPPCGSPCVRIYCDLDGVLADFDAGVAAALPPGLRMRHAAARRGGPPLTEDEQGEFWRAVHASDDFFATVPWCAGGAALWRWLEENCSPTVLSGLPEATKETAATAIQQREAWCAAHLGPHATVICGSNKKLKHSGPGRILIDDNPTICAHWRARGGIAVHHISVENTTHKLEQVLRRLQPQRDADQGDCDGGTAASDPAGRADAQAGPPAAAEPAEAAPADASTAERLRIVHGEDGAPLLCFGSGGQTHCLRLLNRGGVAHIDGDAAGVAALRGLLLASPRPDAEGGSLSSAPSLSPQTMSPWTHPERGSGLPQGVEPLGGPEQSPSLGGSTNSTPRRKLFVAPGPKTPPSTPRPGAAAAAGPTASAAQPALGREGFGTAAAVPEPSPWRTNFGIANPSHSPGPAFRRNTPPGTPSKSPGRTPRSNPGALGRDEFGTQIPKGKVHKAPSLLGTASSTPRTPQRTPRGSSAGLSQWRADFLCSPDTEQAPAPAPAPPLPPAEQRQQERAGPPPPPPDTDWADLLDED